MRRRKSNIGRWCVVETDFVSWVAVFRRSPGRSADSNGSNVAADPRSPEELRKILDAPPPDPKERSKAALSKIYLERRRAANVLGDFDREFNEISQGIGAIGPKDPNSYALHHRLAHINIDRGDFVAARAVREASLVLMQRAAKPERGQPYSYAHPMFWVPFVVAGDGG